MANRKISDLTALTATATGDLLPIVDISEAAAADKNKKITIEKLFQGIPGNVGIGTTNPAYALDVASSVVQVGNSTDAFIQYKSTAGNWHVGAVNSNAYVFYSGTYGSGSERARIDSSGRLLVGTSIARANFFNTIVSPQFQIEGAGDFDRQAAIISSSSTAAFGGVQILAHQKSGAIGGNTILASGDALGTTSFQGSDGTQFVEGARIEAFVDGTPGADDMPGRLVFSVTPDGGSSPTTSPSAMTINSGQEVLIGYSTDNGAYKLQVNSQIFATSATVATSDGRYKENVATLDDCVDLVKALRPVSFDWKHQEPITRINEEGETVVVREAHNFPDGTQVGFIAQEVQEVLAEKPWLTSVIKQNVRPAVNDSDGNELAPEEEFFGIAEGNLVAVLTSALQEAIAKIEALEARLTAAGIA